MKAGSGVARWGGALLFLALAAAVLAAYAPALQGAPLWDDDGHLTRPGLRGLDGLRRIWFDLGATQQYYPVTHSLFWLQHRLWGDAPTGYHVVSVLLHAAAACLLALVLRRLGVPGAALAAFVFALHPVHVESAAWISELKNTLSATLYFGAALAYLSFDRTRSLRPYAGAASLFALALLSKSVTATLPAALLVGFWWKRGRLSWRRDAAPLLPFFLAAAASGALTAWVEKNLIGAQGPEFALTLLQRCFLAGRIVWHYLTKLVLPAGLTFNYPRWDLGDPAWWHYLFLPAILALVAAAAMLGRRRRGPLAALLVFLGSLVPVLGFLDVYPFLFSYVADHFQYLADASLIALGAAGVARLFAGAAPRGRTLIAMMCAALLVALGGATWRRAHAYRSPEALYAGILETNPGSWLAHNGLSIGLLASGDHAAARVHAEAAVTLNPRSADLANGLGAVLAAQGDRRAAREAFVRAIRLDPKAAEARANLGRIHYLEGDREAALAELRTSLRIEEDGAQAHFTLGQLLAGDGELGQAIGHHRRALELKPGWHLPAAELLGIARTAADPSVRESASQAYRGQLR